MVGIDTHTNDAPHAVGLTKTCSVTIDHTNLKCPARFSLPFKDFVRSYGLSLYNETPIECNACTLSLFAEDRIEQFHARQRALCSHLPFTFGFLFIDFQSKAGETKPTWH